MNFNAEQFTATQQANLTAAANLSQTAFAGFERLVELNMAAGKAAVGESFSNMQALMAAKTPQDLMAVQAALVQPAFEKSVSYGRHIADIANSTGAEFTKAVEGKNRPSNKWPTSSKTWHANLPNCQRPWRGASKWRCPTSTNFQPRPHLTCAACSKCKPKALSGR